MEEIFTRQEIELNRTTMARWMVEVGNALIPITNVLSDRMFSAHAIACDETSVQVLKEKGRDAKTKSWMIVRATPCEQKKVVLFDYNTSRSGETMRNLFADYEGRLLCDGLESYNPLESKKLIRFGCSMHARRRFEQAAKDGANASSTLYSLAVTAKLNGVNPYKALCKILAEIPLAKTVEDYERLADVILTPEGSV